MEVAASRFLVSRFLSTILRFLVLWYFGFAFWLLRLSAVSHSACTGDKKEKVFTGSGAISEGESW